MEADIYGLGSSLYFIAAGQDPYPGENSEVLARNVAERKPPPLSGLRDGIPPEAEEFIGRMMSKDPTHRYGRVADVIADLERIKNGQPLAPLKGGKPPGPPRMKPPPPPPPARSVLPVHAGISGNRAAVSGPRAAVSGTRTGISGTIPAAASGSQNPNSKTRIGLLEAVKGGASVKAPGTKVVFGRLETHVKSTIPQSELEKRGDDFHRQGQLPLALSTWRDAFANAHPHAALKVKIELAERELKREAYSSAMDEVRVRIRSGEWRAAIERAREAQLSAENDTQRQDAINLENEAIAGSLAAGRSSKIKLIAGIAAFVVVLFLAFKLFSGGEEAAETTEPEDLDKVVRRLPILSSEPQFFDVIAAGARVSIAEPWMVEKMELQARHANQKDPAAVMRTSKLTGTLSQRRQELLERYKAATKLDDLEVFAMSDQLYPIAELGFSQIENDKTMIRYVYIVGGPSEALYLVEFSGPEETFDIDLRTQMKQIMESWTYQK